jgi:hypothetical protein
LLWFVNAPFVLSPFSGLPLPDFVAPLIGLLMLPTTTLGYCWASASYDGMSSFSGLLIVGIGLLVDLGLIGGGRGIARR